MKPWQSKRRMTSTSFWEKLRFSSWVVLPLVLFIVAALGGLILVRQSSADPAVSTAPPVSCVGVNASDFSCWQSRYDTMVAQQSPEAAFVDFKANYNINPYVKSNCHQLAHVIGRAAAIKYKTLAETYKHGDQFCWSGYYHGAVEQIAQEIGPAKIVADMPSVCASFFKTKPYGFDHYNCVHGMGHGLMVVENDNLFKSLDLCDTYTDSWEQSSCYSGVFMENVMDSILPGHHTNYIKADDPLYPCTAVKQRYEADCYMMQTSHALVVENEDYSKVFSLCSTVQSPYDIDCYQSLGRDVSGNSSSDQATSIQLCMEGPTAVAQDNCFTGAVKDFISYYHSDTQGLALCAAIPDSTLSVSCTSTAHTYYQSF
jgi:hypothetical protein